MGRGFPKFEAFCKPNYKFSDQMKTNYKLHPHLNKCHLKKNNSFPHRSTAALLQEGAALRDQGVARTEVKSKHPVQKCI